ncbi:MAG: hypothetical protein JSV86_08010 [Gemmatimonadota bacterium]|nr:MAG: hypothetical protein JSV86_08010 [Gemmatimonadota bacterium]
MHRRLGSLVTIIAAAALLPTPAAAQVVSPGFAVGATGGFETYSLQIAEREYGPSLEAFLRYTWESSFQLVGGVSYSSINVDIVDDDRRVWTVFVEPRLLLGNWVSDKLTVYVGIRGGYLQQSIDTVVNNQPVDANANGWIFGGTANLLTKLSETVALDVIGLFGLSGSGDPEVNGEPIGMEGEPTAWYGGLKAGLVFSIP